MAGASGTSESRNQNPLGCRLDTGLTGKVKKEIIISIMNTQKTKKSSRSVKNKGLNKLLSNKLSNNRFVLPVVIAFVIASIGVGSYLVATGDAATCRNVTFGQGSSGTCVKYIQTEMNSFGGYGLAIDGQYGPKTASAVKSFQSRWGDRPVDGIVGPITWGTICSFARTWPYAYTAYKDGHYAGCY